MPWLGDENENGEVDDSERLLLVLNSFCMKMDSLGFWRFVTGKKKELESLRAQMPFSLVECLDLARFMLELISEVFPMDKRVEKSEKGNNLGWTLCFGAGIADTGGGGPGDQKVEAAGE